MADTFFIFYAFGIMLIDCVKTLAELPFTPIGGIFTIALALKLWLPVIRTGKFPKRN